MIVDLLRNDIGRIAEIGSVRVPALYAVERYATVHQMVSRVTGRLLPGTPLARVLAALFPCGSVTGAPKLRAMEIIRELEPWPRDAYCGAIGWAAPDGRAAFNVAIRTRDALSRRRGGAERRRRGGGRFDGRVGVRGGAVESPVRGPLPADLTLIETFGRRDGGFVDLADHLARLERSAAALGVPLRPGGDRPRARRRRRRGAAAGAPDAGASTARSR